MGWDNEESGFTAAKDEVLAVVRNIFDNSLFRFISFQAIILIFLRLEIVISLLVLNAAMELGYVYSGTRIPYVRGEFSLGRMGLSGHLRRLNESVWGKQIAWIGASVAVGLLIMATYGFFLVTQIGLLLLITVVYIGLCFLVLFPILPTGSRVLLSIFSGFGWKKGSELTVLIWVLTFLATIFFVHELFGPMLILLMVYVIMLFVRTVVSPPPSWGEDGFTLALIGYSMKLHFIKSESAHTWYLKLSQDDTVDRSNVLVSLALGVVYLIALAVTYNLAKVGIDQVGWENLQQGVCSPWLLHSPFFR